MAKSKGGVFEGKPGGIGTVAEVVEIAVPVKEFLAEVAKAQADQAADEAALLGKMTPHQRALHAFGLEERHVLASKEYTMEDGSVEVVILTQGGQRVRWPQDAERVLSDMEKGDATPSAPPAGIFKAKA